MIYKLIVNAAFLAVGYYIGKQVGLGEQVRKEPGQRSGESPPRSTERRPQGEPPDKD